MCSISLSNKPWWLRHRALNVWWRTVLSLEEKAFEWMSLVKVLFSYMFRILLTGTLNLREMIFDYGKYSHWGPFCCGNVKCGRWTLTFWTNTLAPSSRQKLLLNANYPQHGGSLLYFVMNHKQETRLSTVLTSDIPMRVNTSFISNCCTKLVFTLRHVSATYWCHHQGATIL